MEKVVLVTKISIVMDTHFGIKGILEVVPKVGATPKAVVKTKKAKGQQKVLKDIFMRTSLTKILRDIK